MDNKEWFFDLGIIAQGSDNKRYVDNSIQNSLVHGNKNCFVYSEIIAQGSADQRFEEIHYFQSLHLY